MLFVSISLIRLGEFAPIGLLFTFGRFDTFTKYSQKHFEQLFSTVKVTHWFEKMGWTTFWAIFSKTHPVTLVSIRTILQLSELFHKIHK
jgi:hypothetical protein